MVVEFVSGLFQTPSFLSRLEDYLGSRGKQPVDVDDDIFDNDEDDDMG
ncbi:hypothetical protein HanIR_Chr14g0727331 [Helianthus annuus]|nr:hypothetical protein HanIR_Chr14g0727331 [Helianthus annuus]